MLTKTDIKASLKCIRQAWQNIFQIKPRKQFPTAIYLVTSNSFQSSPFLGDSSVFWQICFPSGASKCLSSSEKNVKTPYFISSVRIRANRLQIVLKADQQHHN